MEQNDDRKLKKHRKVNWQRANLKQQSKSWENWKTESECESQSIWISEPKTWNWNSELCCEMW